MAVTIELDHGKIPEKFKELAAKWTAAAVASLELLQEESTSADDAGVIIDIALHSAAAILAPGELNTLEFIHIVNRFSQALADAGAAFLEDKNAHEATKQ